MGDRFTISLGSVLPPSTIPEFRRLWDRAKQELPPILGAEWRELRALLRDWSEPPLTDRGQPEIWRARQEFAAQILTDLAMRFSGNPGLNSELQKAADRLGTLDLDLCLERDPVFELLFDDDALPSDEEEAKRAAEMEALASSWALLDPAKTVAGFSAVEAAARTYRPHLNFWRARKFGALLAAVVDRPEAWLAATLDAEQGFALAKAFLRRMADLKRPGWEKAIERCLSLERTAWSAAEAVLQMEDPPGHLLAIALNKATGFPQLVETLASGNHIPPKTLLRLLDHCDWRLAAAAAIGEWNAATKGQVRCELQASWRSAILRTRGADYMGELVESSLDIWLEAILVSDPDLALGWLRARLDDVESLPFTILMEETSVHSHFATAIRNLSPGKKLELLDTLGPMPPNNDLFVRDLLTLLIARDSALYGELLKREHPAAYRLAPLRGRPDPAWAALAALALEHGASAEAIVEEAYSVPRMIAGSGVDYWQSWKAAFETLLSDPRPGIREIGRLGSERAQELVREAEKEWQEVQRRGF
jgi:hypothetical protein